MFKVIIGSIILSLKLFVWLVIVIVVLLLIICVLIIVVVLGIIGFILFGIIDEFGCKVLSLILLRLVRGFEFI